VSSADRPDTAMADKVSCQQTRSWIAAVSDVHRYFASFVECRPTLAGEEHHTNLGKLLGPPYGTLVLLLTMSTASIKIADWSDDNNMRGSRTIRTSQKKSKVPRVSRTSFHMALIQEEMKFRPKNTSLRGLRAMLKKTRSFLQGYVMRRTTRKRLPTWDGMSR
jgi:hypothetical protein